ncbi:MAG: hypothetical protein V4650_07900 [Pseudomonadota bacterium]
MSNHRNWKQCFSAIAPSARSAAALVALAFTAAMGSVHAAPPPAGAVIGNQATATYVDATNVTRTTTSNLVETLVAQVYAVDIETTQTQTATPGSTVYFPHIITNPGNGSDSYTLTAPNPAGGTFDFSSVVIYPDANQDGQPDSFTPIAVTPSIAAGGTYGIVIAAVVPGTALSGNTDSITVTSTSNGDGTKVDANTDTVTITNNAVISVTKSESVSSGVPGSPGTATTYTLTYTNTGNATATAVTLTDNLNAAFAYTATSGRWSVTGATALTDAVGGDPAGIDYSRTGQTVTAIIASVAAGQSGTVSFTVTIAPGTAPGVVPNFAALSYNDGGAGGGATVTDNSNTVNFTVAASASLVLTDDNGGEGSGTDDGADANDVVLENTASQGSAVLFDNVLRNTGTGTDTYELTLEGSTFPAGTTFQLLRGDGVTPLTDSTGNGVPDSGPLAAGAPFHVIVRATLPGGATGGPFSVTLRARSTLDPTQTDIVTDTLTLIATSSVDIRNDSATGGGAGAGPEAAPVTTVTTNPGSTAVFSLFINNTSTVADSYNLLASTDSTFATVALPAGWTVTFRTGSATGPTISNTGTIAPAASLNVFAVVSVPAGSAPVAAPGTSIFFRAASPVSGALDVKNDAVVVSTLRDLAITPNNANQAFPGGSVDYVHTLRNNSNVTETVATLTSVNSDANWTSVIYFDANNNGTVDPTDPVVDNLNDVAGGLAPGASLTLIQRVFVPLGSTPGSANTTTIQIDNPNVITETDETNNISQDVTTVVTGDLTLTKRQALDTNCDGTPDTAFTGATINSALAIPGACVVYQITANNTGSTPVTNVTISDATPSLTTLETCAGACAAAATASTVSSPADEATGLVTTGAITLAPAATNVLTFTVQINTQ